MPRIAHIDPNRRPSPVARSATGSVEGVDGIAPAASFVTGQVCPNRGGYDSAVIPLRSLVLSLGASIGVLYPFIAVILGTFGFTPRDVGGILALAAVASALAVPTWGHLADVRIGRTGALRACALGASAAALGLLVHWPPLVVVVLVIAMYLFVSSYQPLVDALTVNTIRGRGAYARVRLLSSLSFAISVVVAGYLYDRSGYWLAFVLFAALSGVMALATSRLPDVARANLAAHASAATRTAASGAGNDAAAHHAPARRRYGSAGVAFKVAPRLPAVLFTIAVLHIGLIASFTFIGVRIVDLGGKASDVALASGVSAACEVPSMFIASWIGLRIGLRTMFAGSALLYAIVLLVWAIADSPTVIIVSRVATGVAFTGIIVSIVLTIAALLPSDLQATGQALFQTTTAGIGAVIANVVGGLLYQGVGSAAVFGSAAALALIAAVLGFLVFPARSSRAPVR
jgi:MFS transporter, PPP family, 3-phenylpropionic acid transporter